LESYFPIESNLLTKHHARQEKRPRDNSFDNFGTVIIRLQVSSNFDGTLTIEERQACHNKEGLEKG
jgi:hypothetical protein